MSDVNITPGSDAQAPVSQPAAQQPAPQAPVAPAPAAPSQPAPATNNPTGDGQIPQNNGQPTADLYELPDGRKVDAATLSKEWKENFLPDYTRKSQMIASQQPPQAQPQQPNQVINNPQQTPATPVWQDPNWIPTTYAEIVDAAAQKMQYDQQQRQVQQEQYTQQVNQFVDSQIAEIKQLEPNLSEELLFQHANKYSFSDLKQAYQNMKDFNLAVQRTQQQTVQNLQNRANDPIAVKSGQQVSSNAIDYKSIQNNNLSAIDMLRRIQGK